MNRNTSVQLLKRMTYEEFLVDSLYHSAVIRYLEVIGEAVKHIPDSIRSAYPDVPWRKIAGMRDVLIHDYVNVNLTYVWQVATAMAPLLYRRVLNMIDTIDHGK